MIKRLEVSCETQRKHGTQSCFGLKQHFTARSLDEPSQGTSSSCSDRNSATASRDDLCGMMTLTFAMIRHGRVHKDVAA